MQEIRLIYASTPIEGTTITDVEGILSGAVTANKRRDITGYLTFRDSFFVQVLEGDRQTVTELFSRICADPRHQDVELISSVPITERLFAQWSMGYACLSNEGRDALSRLGDNRDSEPRDLEPQKLLEWLQEVAGGAAV